MTKFGEYIVANWRDLFRQEMGYVCLYVSDSGQTCNLNPDRLTDPDALINRVQSQFDRSREISHEKFRWARRIYDETIEKFPRQRDVYVMIDGALVTIDSEIGLSTSFNRDGVIEKLDKYITNSGGSQLAIVSGKDYPEFIRLTNLERSYWLRIRKAAIVRNSLLTAYARHCVSDEKNRFCVVKVNAGVHRYTITLDGYKREIFEETDRFSPVVYVELFSS